jgi:hypothetical protein
MIRALLDLLGVLVAGACVYFFCAVLREMDQYEREEQAISDAYGRGDISNAEMRKQLRALQRDYRDAAQEAAREAYERELDRW